MTDTAVGEAGWCCLSGIERVLVSLTPSDWEFSSVSIDWILGSGAKKTVAVENHWTSESVKALLQAAQAPLDSWRQLEAQARTRCTELTFDANAFSPWKAIPSFQAPPTDCTLFSIRYRFKSCFAADGRRTAEGHELYRKFFTGKIGKERPRRGLLRFVGR